MTRKQRQHSGTARLHPASATNARGKETAPDLQNPLRRYQKLECDKRLELFSCKSIMSHVTVKGCRCCCCCCCCCSCYCDMDECRSVMMMKTFSCTSALAASPAPLRLRGSRRDPQGASLCALVCNYTLSTDHHHNHQSTPLVPRTSLLESISLQIQSHPHFTST